MHTVLYFFQKGGCVVVPSDLRLTNKKHQWTWTGFKGTQKTAMQDARALFIYLFIFIDMIKIQSIIHIMMITLYY